MAIKQNKSDQQYFMIYHDSMDQAIEFGRKAMEQMAIRRIPPTPANFTVWYTQVSDREPDLTRMISILDDNGQEFTESVCVDLYNKFIVSGVDDETLHSTTGRIEDELQRILGYVGEAGEDVMEYGKTLADAKGDISIAKDIDGLKGALSKVLSETRKMEEVNQTLEHKLAESTEEIGQLRDDLEDMRKEALTDALTGIANRKLFDMELRRQARDAMEAGEDLALLMLDIDHFKRFNDTYGHQTGDQVLKLLAAIMTSSVKGDDIPARYGGEEFTVILPRTNLKGALKVAEGIRKRISSKTLVNRTTKEDLGQLTVSIGASVFEFGEPLPDLIKRADQALYLAKTSGRDRVMSQDDLSAEAVSFT